MATLLIEALKGAQAEVAEQQGLYEQLKRAGRLTTLLAQEMRTALSLSPFGVRAVRVRSALPTSSKPLPPATTAATAAVPPYGVVLHPAIPYGAQPRHKVDIYVPSSLQQHQEASRGQQQQQQQQQHGAVPVVFFVHGGIWVTGERWHFSPLATCLAQSGLVVVVPSYTLYPEALADEMAVEVLAAYKWTAQHATRYGGDASHIFVVGHSAGGHLASLALMLLAQQKLTAHQQLLQHQEEVEQDVQKGAQWAAYSIDQTDWGHQKQQQQQKEKTQPESVDGHMHHLAEQHLRQQQRLAAASDHQSVAGAHHPQQQQQTATAPVQTTHKQQDSPAVLGRTMGRSAARQLQEQQQPGLHWCDDDAQLLSSPIPTAFIGMASIYDVKLHFQFEAQRGVSGISTMARACGGAARFDAVSPAAVLRRAAAAANAVGTAAADFTEQQTGSDQQYSQQFTHQLAQQHQHAKRPSITTTTEAPRQVLLGEDLPLRSGLEGRAAAAQLPILQPRLSGARRPGGDPSGPDASPAAAETSYHAVSSRVRNSTHSDRAGDGAARCGKAASFANFTAAAAAYMPPCILMSSLADHMVPWHEAAEMCLALRSCGVPAKHLIYDRILHNDFVLDWNPTRVPPAAGSGARGQVAQQKRPTNMLTGSSSGGSYGMPLRVTLPCAQDLLWIVTGQVKVRFDSGDVRQALTALEALESAAGLPQPALRAGSQLAAAPTPMMTAGSSPVPGAAVPLSRL